MNWMMSSASLSLTPSGSFWSSWKPFSNEAIFLVLAEILPMNSSEALKEVTLSAVP
jgi:hypothetical protein